MFECKSDSMCAPPPSFFFMEQEYISSIAGLNVTALFIQLFIYLNAQTDCLFKISILLSMKYYWRNTHSLPLGADKTAELLVASNFKDVTYGQIQNVFGPLIWNIDVKKTGGAKSGTSVSLKVQFQHQVIPSLVPPVPLFNHQTYFEIWQQIPRDI